MARKFITGGESGSVLEVLSASAGLSVDSSQANGGAYSYKFVSNTAANTTWVTGLNSSHLYFKGYFRFDNDAAPSSQTIIECFRLVGASNEALAIVALYHETSGVMHFGVTDSASSFVGFGSNLSLAKNTWYRFELDFQKGAGTGALTAYVDGVSQASFSSQQFGSVNIDKWLMGLSSGDLTSRNFWFDDLEVDDAGLCGASFVIARQFKVAVPTYGNWNKDGIGAMPAYVGPGDLVSGALAWYGLRAYSAGSIGSNAVRLRRDSDNAEQDFVTLADGSLDVASITTFKGAANLKIVTLYDQAGSARDATNGTAAEQPALILSGLGALPIIRWTLASSQQLSFGSFPAQSQPYTLHMLVDITDTTTATQKTPLFVGVVLFGVDGGFGGNSVGLYDGGTGFFTTSFTHSVWQSFSGVVNGASTDINVNGTSHTGAFGNSTGNSSGFLVLGGGGGVGNPIGGDSLEFGIWPSAFSTSQSLALYNNQQAYWGF